eukprot:1283363-Rhodomonas_salina.1
MMIARNDGDDGDDGHDDDDDDDDDGDDGSDDARCWRRMRVRASLLAVVAFVSLCLCVSAPLSLRSCSSIGSPLRFGLGPESGAEQYSMASTVAPYHEARPTPTQLSTQRPMTSRCIGVSDLF